jgi:hypothetical protein
MDFIQQLITVGENQQNTIEQLKRVIAEQHKDITELQQQLASLYNYVFYPKLNREKISYEISVKLKNGYRGCENITNRAQGLIVSLTSYPERMYEIKYTLYSLLNQTLKPDMIILWLTEDEFPNREKDIASEITELQNFGLTIKWCKNIKSYKKLIPALNEFPDACIVTADDDLYYDENWLRVLYDAYLKKPEYVHCHRAHRVQISGNTILPYCSWQHEISSCPPSFYNFATGVGGALYPPLNSNIYYKDLTNENLFTELCPSADDIWFWAMEILQGTKVNIVENCKKYSVVNWDREIDLSSETRLGAKNLSGGNDEALVRLVNHYPQIIEILKMVPAEKTADTQAD